MLNLVSGGSFVIIYSSRCGFTTHIASETIPKNLKSQTFLEGMLPDLMQLKILDRNLTSLFLSVLDHEAYKGCYVIITNLNIIIAEKL